jgi:hypothetical protein
MEDDTMGFLTGRVSYVRFQVDGPSPGIFGPEHLEKLAARSIGKQVTASKDGTEAGWIAGDDILDLGFDLAKNVINDALHYSLRLDTQKLPAELLRAYAREELQVLAAANPSGKPSAKQKKEAKEAARQKLEAEAKDGRFTRRKAYPLLWDGPGNQLLVGTTSAAILDHAQRLFKETFGCELTPIDAGRRALQQRKEEVDLRPSAFAPSGESGEVAWVNDPANPSYLGNEFLLWLWFTLEMDGDTIPLADGSEVAVMMVRTLALECPRAISGSETIRSDGPTKLPEARRAIQAGKLPRQAGLILARHGSQYELTLQAETLAVSPAKLPPVEEKDRAGLDERVGQVRHLKETVDLLFDAFLDRRLKKGWPDELLRMRRWLGHEEVGRAAA